MLASRRSIGFVVVVAFLVANSPRKRPCAAQARATVSGTVRNAAGAPQRTKTVTLVAVDTQNERQAITEDDGTFVIGGLAPGRYQLKVDEAGFAPFTGDIMTLAAGERRTANIALRPVAAPAPARLAHSPSLRPLQLPRQLPSPARPPGPQLQPRLYIFRPFAPASPLHHAPSGNQPPTPKAPATPAVVVPDYIPSPDRWRLEFPVWQRYPPELKGDYPYVTGPQGGPV